MKRTSSVCVILLFVSIAFNGLIAQKTDPMKYMNKYLGAWQAQRGKDTIEVWDFKAYGPQAYVVDIYHIIGGKKMPVSFNPISFDPATGKFYGFTLLVSGYYGTWIGSFTSENKFDGDMLANFNPQPVYGRLENIFVNPGNWICNLYTPQGSKYLELSFVKFNQ